MFAESFNNPYYDSTIMSNKTDAGLRCPVCNADMTSYTKEHVEKHLRRCSAIEPKYVYSDKGPGRPPKKKKISTC